MIIWRENCTLCIKLESLIYKAFCVYTSVTTIGILSLVVFGIAVLMIFSFYSYFFFFFFDSLVVFLLFFFKYNSTQLIKERQYEKYMENNFVAFSILTGLSPPHVYVCPTLVPEFSTSYVVVFLRSMNSVKMRDDCSLYWWNR